MDNNGTKLPILDEADIMKLMSQGGNFLDNLPEIKRPSAISNEEPLPDPSSIPTEPYYPEESAQEPAAEYAEEQPAYDELPQDVSGLTSEITYEPQQPAYENEQTYQPEQAPAFEELSYDETQPAPAYEEPIPDTEAPAFEDMSYDETAAPAYEAAPEAAAYDTELPAYESIDYTPAEQTDASAYQSEQTAEGDFSENGYLPEETTEELTYEQPAAPAYEETYAQPEQPAYESYETTETAPAYAEQTYTEPAYEQPAYDEPAAPAYEEQSSELDYDLPPIPKAAPAPASAEDVMLRKPSFDFDFELPDLPKPAPAEKKPEPVPSMPKPSLDDDFIPDFVGENDGSAPEEAESPLEKTTEKYDTMTDLDSLEAPPLSEMDGAAFNVKKNKEKISTKTLTPQDLAQQEFDMIADGKDVNESDYLAPEDAKKNPVPIVVGSVALLAAIAIIVMFFMK